MAAGGIGGEIDRGAALRARDLPDRRAQPGEFPGRWRPDEILLAQELVVGDQPPVIPVAAPVRETGGPLQILGRLERGLAPRTAEPRSQRHRCARISAARAADVLEQVEHRPRAEADAFMLVEP